MSTSSRTGCRTWGRPVTWPQLVACREARRGQITWSQITGRSRRAPIVRRRIEVCHTIWRRFRGMTLRDIGQILGGRTAQTVWYEIQHYYTLK